MLATLFSCHNQLNEFDEKNAIEQIEIIEEDNFLKGKGVYSFIYKGKTYYSNYYLAAEENDMILQDEEVANIVNLLNLYPGVTTFIHENGDIEYFENEESMLASLTNILQTRASNINGTLQVYEHIDYQGKNFAVSLSNTCREIAIRHVTTNCRPVPYGPTPNLHDKISSFILKGNATVTFYQDVDYKNNSITFSQPINVYSLKDYPLYPGSKKNWNDQISSLIFKSK